MAGDKDELELGSDDNNEQAAKKKSPLMLIIVVAVVVLAGGAGGWFFMAGSPADDSTKATQVVESAGDEQSKDDEKATKADAKPAKYVPFGSDIVVNIGENTSHNIIVAVSIMTRDDETYEAIKKHKPLLRNALIELFEEQNYQSIMTLEGKQQLRKKSLETIKTVLVENKEKNQVEAVLFTNFMMD